jgi:hypothetical protein
MNFPDLPHLIHLQKELWRWPKSRAAVMVGAGISLNAETLPGVSTRFPTWRELVRAMFEELYPPHLANSTEPPSAREERFNRANPLRIASQYEAAFGRRKLDLLIRDQNPDSDYQPGALHQSLLQLPWADVFTTNYDTLLERTEIPGRTYHPVTKSSELTTAFPPRIIKLHGSFPSQTPFIISEEDYRTYPRRFAPFVNSVQQSLIENSLVLIGFSGDDPNFLEWTGWIRDQLGGNHAPIYLVGPLSLGNAERSLLTQRDVTAIDLSPVFEGISTPNGIHEASIKWFLNSLLAARKARPEKWPDLSRSSLHPPGNPPPIGDTSEAIPDEVGLSPHGPVTPGLVGKVIERWRFERKKYPGWTVLPEQKRSELWRNTRLWIGPLVQFGKDLPAVDRVFLLREINWRLETAMTPSFSDLVEPFQYGLDELFDALLGDRLAEPSSNVLPATAAAWKIDVTDAWLEVAFGLLREARESYNEPRWNELKARIDTVVRQHNRQSDKSLYETALWAMWNVERAKAKDIVSRWQPPSRFPLAAMWKAGLLAELDELGEARTTLRSALLEIRRALRTQGQNIELLSLEGWCTYLLFAVEQALDSSARERLREEFWERWQELKAWDCDPWPHIEYFKALNDPPHSKHKGEMETRDFDPGRVTVSFHLGGDTNEIDPYLPGFACVRLFEQVGIPMRLHRLNIAGDMLRNGCRWVAPFTGFWSPSLLVRAGKVDDLKKGDFLGRPQVAAMEPTLARRAYSWCLQIFRREIVFLTGPVAMGSAQADLIEVLSEALSRLTLGAEDGQLRETFPMVLQLYAKPGVRAHPRLHDCCTPWFRRLFEAAKPRLLLEWFPELIRAPLSDEGAFIGMPAGAAWPDPMRDFPRAVRAPKGCDDLVAKVNDATNWLLRRAASESGEGRRRAVERLIKVYHSRLMTVPQETDLAGLLWNERNASNLPDRPNYAVFGLLNLPVPSDLDVRAEVKQHILALSPAGIVSRNADGNITIAIGAPEQSLIFEAALASRPAIEIEERGTIDWTPEEAKQLCAKAREWWENDKVALEKNHSGFGSAFVKNTGNRLGQFLARVVLPRMEGADENEWCQLLGWLKEMRELGVYPTAALPYVLLHRQTEGDAVAEIIATDIGSDLKDAVAAAAKAIRHWVRLHAENKVPAPPSGLMTALVERVLFRRGIGVSACLSHLASIIVETRDAIGSPQAALVAASLIPWHEATILPVPGDDPGDFDDAARPDLRTRIASLAGALGVWYAKSVSREPEPVAVAKWRDLCASDPLPEVRRAFDIWNLAE